MFENPNGLYKSILCLFLLALLPVAIPYLIVVLPVLWNLLCTAIIHCLNHRFPIPHRNQSEPTPSHLDNTPNSNTIITDDNPSINRFGFDYSPEDDDTIEEEVSEAESEETETDFSPSFHSPLSFEERKRQKKLQNREILDLFNLNYVTDDEEEEDDDYEECDHNEEGHDLFHRKDDYFDFHKRSLFDGTVARPTASRQPSRFDRIPLYNEDYGSDDDSEESSSNNNNNNNNNNSSSNEEEDVDHHLSSRSRISESILRENRRILTLAELNQQWTENYAY